MQYLVFRHTLAKEKILQTYNLINPKILQPLHLQKNIFIKRNDVKRVDFGTFIIFFKGIQSIFCQQRKNKEGVYFTLFQFIKELEKREEWQKLVYLVFSYSTGCRHAEVRRLLKEVVSYESKGKELTVIDKDGNEKRTVSKSYLTHTIRCKGVSIVGKQHKLKFGDDAMKWIKKWRISFETHVQQELQGGKKALLFNPDRAYGFTGDRIV